MGHVGVRFRVLGAFEAHGPDGPLDLGGPKRRALLALLVLRAGQATSVESIVDALWGEQAPVGAPKTVRTYVSQLRKQLGAAAGRPPFAAGSGRYELVIADDVDAVEFEQLVMAGIDEADLADRVAALDDALALWRGDPLPEFAGAGWADQALNHWRRLHRVAQEGRTDALLALGRHREVLPLLERLVVDEPLHERYWAQLVVARHGAGRRADALSAAREVRRILGLELGIEPGSEILDLERRIIDGDDDLLVPSPARAATGRRVLDVTARDDRPARPPLPAAPAPATGARAVAAPVAIDLTTPVPAGGARHRPFVGRDRDLAALRSAIDRACVGEGGVALVTGEAGIGKSRLVEEATRDCAARGVAVVWGRASEAGGAPAFWPWLQVLRSAADAAARSDLAEDAGDTGLLARLIPVLASPTGVARPEALVPADDEGARFRLFDAACRFLLRRAERLPLVVVIEDIQWADESTLLLVEHLTPLLPGSRLLLAATCREVHVDRHHRLTATLAELTRVSVATVGLRGLEVGEVGELIRSITGDDCPAATVERIASRTNGNPYFVGEIARLGDERLPPTIAAVVRNHLRSLTDDQFDILSTAALIGREIDPDLVADVAGVSEADVEDALDAAVTANIVDSPGRSLRFVHALVREVLVEDVPLHLRRERHRRVARALAGFDDHRLDQAAHHWFVGARPADVEEAVPVLLRAGSRASSLLAHGEAARHYDHAVSLLAMDPSADRRRRCDVLHALGDARMRNGELASGQAPTLEALSIAREMGDGPRLVRAALAYCGPPRISRRDELAASLVHEALRWVDPEGQPSVAARLHANLALMPAIEFPAAEHAARGVALAERTGDPAVLSTALGSQWWRCFDTADVRKAYETGQRQLGAARAAASPELEIDAEINLLETAWYLGDRDARASGLRAVRRLAQTLRMPWYEGMAATYEARERIAEGNLADAEAKADPLYDIAVAEGQNIGGVYGAQQFGIISLQDREAEFEPIVRSMADAVAEELLDVDVAYKAALARHYAEVGRTDDAAGFYRSLFEDDMEAPGRLYGCHQAVVLGLVAEACVVLASRTEAPMLLRLLQPWLGLHLQVTPSLYLGPTSLYVGQLEQILGRTDDAVAHLEQAVDEARAAGVAACRPIQPEVALARALAERRRPGDVAAATELLVGARRSAQRLGLVRFARQCAAAEALLSPAR
jgi:DNA-binding SARP family transcriptional activator/tetratricopeptide (TPR) repeat protein